MDLLIWNRTKNGWRFRSHETQGGLHLAELSAYRRSDIGGLLVIRSSIAERRELFPILTIGPNARLVRQERHWRQTRNLMKECRVERTLAYLAGHRDMSITKRYVHPQEYNTRAAIEKARVALGGHNSGHSPISTVYQPILNLPVTS